MTRPELLTSMGARTLIIGRCWILLVMCYIIFVLTLIGQIRLMSFLAPRHDHALTAHYGERW